MKFSPDTHTPSHALSYGVCKLFLKEFILSAIVVISPLIYPATAHAGFFSAFGSVFGDFVSAKTQDEPMVPNLQNMTLLQAATNQDPNPNRTGIPMAVVSGNALVAEISPQATATDVDDEFNTQISTYVVRQGDSLSKIAKLFSVSVNTIIWANDLGSNPTLTQGQTLVILPISGVRHTVKKGENLKTIVSKYKADLNEVLQYNDLAPGVLLAEGDTLIIPDGEIAVDTSRTPSKKTSPVFRDNPVHDANGPDYPGYYMRPIVGGHKSQGLHGYNGVDLANPVGSPIYAAAEGTVIVSITGGWNGGYGNYVVISHSNGTQTLYGHTKENLVVPGEKVEKGQMIARVGLTGKTTGPHVHFEIRGARNPF
ncbi:MAG: peptidase family protein [Candidatus Taylorbacteria bacterium]|nr:peptidase family protein [Candidatus Taylorbacteria bacterium]